jgi:hypothetical protein
MADEANEHIMLELSRDDLRELADVLHWAVFQIGYAPRAANREHLEALATRIGFQAMQLVPFLETSPNVVALKDYVNVFLNPNDTQKPYHVFLFKDGVGVEVMRLYDLESTAELCKQYAWVQA